MRQRVLSIVVLLMFVVSINCGGKDDLLLPTSPEPPKQEEPNNPPPTPPPPPSSPLPQPVADAILIGAGDIARCRPSGLGPTPEVEETAKILDQNPGMVMTLGDHAYPANGQGFQNCYEPTWGRHKHRTKPAFGNHENEDTNNNPEPFFSYFLFQLIEVMAVRDRFHAYYSYMAGAWQVVVLNSEAPLYTGSEQWMWLKEQLSNNHGCRLAYWHRPLFSKGQNGNSPDLYPIWVLLHQAKTEIVINGHEHFYERSAPQTPEGKLDPESGIRQFIVGTGGAELYPYRAGPNAENGASVHGVLRLTLRQQSYDWQFLSIPGSGFYDSNYGISVPCR